MQKVEKSQDRSVLHGRLYSSLDELVEDGFIEKGELDGRTNYNSIIDEGYEKAQARHEWERQFLEARLTANAE